MKKLILIGLLLASTIFAYAQKDVKVNNSGKNEIKINLLNAVLALPEINYERILDDNMGAGLAVSFGLGNEDDFSEYKFLVIPHYRIYFGKKQANGFFIEANAGLGNVRERYYYNGYNNSSSAYDNTASFNFGLGAAVGIKFLTLNGFVGEVYGGAGRFLGENRSIEAYPRIGISIGKRF